MSYHDSHAETTEIGWSESMGQRPEFTKFTNLLY